MLPRGAVDPPCLKMCKARLWMEQPGLVKSILPMARVLELNNLQGSNSGLSVITELGQYLIPAGLT